MRKQCRIRPLPRNILKYKGSQYQVSKHSFQVLKLCYFQTSTRNLEHLVLFLKYSFKKYFSVKMSLNNISFFYYPLTWKKAEVLYTLNKLLSIMYLEKEGMGQCTKFSIACFMNKSSGYPDHLLIISQLLNLTPESKG